MAQKLNFLVPEITFTEFSIQLMLSETLENNVKMLSVTPQVSVHLNTITAHNLNLKERCEQLIQEERSNKSQSKQKKLKEKGKRVKSYPNFNSKMCTKF